MLKEIIDKKTLKLLIIFGISLIVIWLLILIIKKPTGEKIEEYVLSNGYTLVEDGIYEKVTSSIKKEDYDTYVRLNKNAEYSVNKFDKYNFELSKETYEFDDGITSYLLENYDYKNNLLDYNYRITSSSINVIFRGDYDISTKEFTCQKELSYGVSLSNTEKVICDKVKLNVLAFMTYADGFFKNAAFDKYMKNHVDNETIEK